MNLNPFLFHYQVFENCPIATFLSGFLSGVQRLFLIFSIIIGILMLTESMAEFLIPFAAFVLLYLLLRFYKKKWCKKVAAKEISKNNP